MTSRPRPSPADPAPSITITGHGEVVVCALAGDLHRDNEDRIRHALVHLLERRPAVLAVDLSAVSLFTSSSLNALLIARRQALARGVELVLLAPSASVRSVLKITEADTLLRIVASIEQALGGPGQDQ